MILLAAIIFAQATAVEARQDTARSALMAAFNSDEAGFAKLIAKGARVVDTKGRAAPLKLAALRRFTTDCSLVDWGHESDRNWAMLWFCQGGSGSVEMSFSFKGKTISKVDLLMAPPTLLQAGAEPPVAHFPDTVNRY